MNKNINRYDEKNISKNSLLKLKKIIHMEKPRTKSPNAYIKKIIIDNNFN